MTCKINADTTDGLKIVSDTSGAVDVQSNGTTRMTVLANGNVGIGASSPTTKLDIAGSILVDAYNNGGAGGGIFLRGGFLSTAQPSITVADHDGSAPDGISINGNDGVSFRTANTERARIDVNGVFLSQATVAYSDGSIGRGALQVDGRAGSRTGITLRAKSTDGSSDVTSNVSLLGAVNGNGFIGGISVNGTTTTFATSSDYRLKENVSYTFDATARLKQLKPARFNFIADADITVDGFLAHEVSSIVPEAITGTKDAEITTKNNVINANGHVIDTAIEEADWTAGKAGGRYPSDSTWAASATKPNYQSIDQSKLVPLLVKTIQELEARITALES